MKLRHPLNLDPWAVLWVALVVVLAVHAVASGSSAPTVSASCVIAAC